MKYEIMVPEWRADSGHPGGDIAPRPTTEETDSQPPGDSLAGAGAALALGSWGEVSSVRFRSIFFLLTYVWIARLNYRNSLLIVIKLWRIYLLYHIYSGQGFHVYISFVLKK